MLNRYLDDVLYFFTSFEVNGILQCRYLKAQTLHDYVPLRTHMPKTTAPLGEVSIKRLRVAIARRNLGRWVSKNSLFGQ